jgi:GT2 family glycosyltransferase
MKISKTQPKNLLSIVGLFCREFDKYFNGRDVWDRGILTGGIELTVSWVAFNIAKGQSPKAASFEYIFSYYSDPIFIIPKGVLSHLRLRTGRDASILRVISGNIFFIKSGPDRPESKVIIFSRLEPIGSVRRSHATGGGDDCVTTYFSALKNNSDTIWVKSSLYCINNFLRSDVVAMEFRGDDRINPSNSITSVGYVAGLSKAKASIIIPVYGQFALLSRLLDSIFDSEDSDLIEEVLISDDASSDPCGILERICSRFGARVHVVRQVSNKGFLKNCNSAFAQTHGEFVVLLNSDIIVPRLWLSRMMAPFEDPKTGLATPLATDGENLTMPIPSGANWREVDSLMRWMRPSYPDASTAIGYCLGIRTSIIRGPLFSDDYLHGYGEDSDLHFRVRGDGFNSVVVDNLLVHHDHGSSYANHSIDRNALRKTNHRIFIEKWGNEYKREQSEFALEKGRWFPQIESRELSKQRIKYNYIFISPVDDRRYGGVKIIYELAEFLLNSGSTVAILINDGKEVGASPCQIAPFRSVPSLIDRVEYADYVISSSFDTIPLGGYLSTEFNAAHINLTQGPEAVFSGGRYFSQYIELIRSVDSVVVVSNFLKKHLLENFQVESKCIYFGPSDLVTYCRQLDRDPLAIAVCLNDTPEKGAGFSFMLAKRLVERGYKIISFGSFTGEIPDFMDHRGWLSSDGTAELLSQVSYFIESSFYEGLGLLSIEAVRCGSLPLIRRNGSAEEIFESICPEIFWDSFSDFDSLVGLIGGIEEERRRVLVEKLAIGSMAYSAERARNIFSEILNRTHINTEGASSL